MFMRLIYNFDTEAIIWPGIVPEFMKIYKDERKIVLVCVSEQL